MKTENKLIGTGILTAVAASLCCITPVLALVAGSGALATSFTWLEPFRPYLIAITFLVLAFACFQKLKPRKQTDCTCPPSDKTSFIQSKSFLAITSIFTIIMLAFPYYSTIFYPKTEKAVAIGENKNTETVTFSIKGMSCASCEQHINMEVNKLSGIKSCVTSYENENSIIVFDRAKTNTLEIENAILKTGYIITEKK